MALILHFCLVASWDFFYSEKLWCNVGGCRCVKMIPGYRRSCLIDYLKVVLVCRSKIHIVLFYLLKCYFFILPCNLLKLTKMVEGCACRNGTFVGVDMCICFYKSMYMSERKHILVRVCKYVYQGRHIYAKLCVCVCVWGWACTVDVCRSESVYVWRWTCLCRYVWVDNLEEAVKSFRKFWTKRFISMSFIGHDFLALTGI